jgi:hypothetical protein
MDQKDLSEELKRYTNELLRVKQRQLRVLHFVATILVAAMMVLVFVGLLRFPTIGKTTILVAFGSIVGLGGGILSVVRTLFREKQVSDVLIQLVKQERWDKKDVEGLLAQLKTLSD